MAPTILQNIFILDSLMVLHTILEKRSCNCLLTSIADREENA